MAAKLAAADVLDREFLEIRRRLLDIAAALDRIDRADGADAAHSNPRVTKLHEAMCVLVDGEADRVERVQMVFSDPYEKDWRATQL